MFLQLFFIFTIFAVGFLFGILFSGATLKKLSHKIVEHIEEKILEDEQALNSSETEEVV